MAGLFITDRAKNPKDRIRGQRVQIVQRADDVFPFLHDTMIAFLGGRLLMAWYNCSEAEIVGRTVIRGRWSADGGKSWSEPEIICEDSSGMHMVPVTFSEYGEEIWAYVTKMRAHDRPTGYVCLKYDGHSWSAQEQRREPLLLNTLPQTIGGQWIAGGRKASRPGELPLIPVVAISEQKRCADWTTIPLIAEREAIALQYPETAILVDRANIDAIVRNDDGPMLTFESSDGGKQWRGPFACDIPILPAKMYGGSLPDGRQYLLYNEQTKDHSRSRLVLAVRKGHGAPFDRSYLLADGYDAETGAGPNWHYPCACIADGWMYVSCTASDQSVRRNGALFSFPLEALA